MDYWVGKRLILLLFVQLLCIVRGNLVFQVHHRYGSRVKTPLRELSAHDALRHGRQLSDIDFQLGGDGSPTSAALYYTKITIGTPPQDYHVQVDTGSDILWVNCKDCLKCPTKSDLDIQLRQYDLTASSTGKMITCDQDFCGVAFRDPNPNCKAGLNCEYSITYGDGSVTEGFFVRDFFRFDQVTGNLQTTSMNGSIAFGCSSKQSGDLGSSSQAVDGIVGFGQSNTSMLSQLALDGKVKKVFSHCLDGSKGGGIFAIGEVVHPRVNGTALVPNSTHYNVILKAIDVGGESLSLPFDLFDTGASRGAIIDSGTTLAYLPFSVYQQLIDQMAARQPGLKTHVVEQQFTCFWYAGNIDDGFPVVNFHFEGALPLSVYPHDYLFEVRDTEYCIGWMSSEMKTKDGKELTLLGDIVLADKLVVYDLENGTVGWTSSYNCSSNITLRDEMSGHDYIVGSHNLSSGFSLSKANFMSLSSLLISVAILLRNVC